MKIEDLDARLITYLCAVCVCVCCAHRMIGCWRRRGEKHWERMVDAGYCRRFSGLDLCECSVFAVTFRKWSEGSSEGVSQVGCASI